MGFVDKNSMLPPSPPAIKTRLISSINTFFPDERPLEGEVRKVSGVLPLVRGAQQKGFREIYVPRENATEAGLVKGIKIYPISSLNEVVNHLNGRNGSKIKKQVRTKIPKNSLVYENNFCIIQGQETAKRALEIAASGGHNIGMYGPPGTGKTMLAKAFQSIIPSLQYEEILEVTGIHSVARTLDKPFIVEPPFRSPHHTASYASLVGGGPFPKPGEITLAHRGVLFLDEFPEFDKKVIEALRQPLEDRSITISRAKGTLTFPAECILIASMNPCPCGYGKEKGCTCLARDISSYQKKISGAIIDRIDIWVSVSKIQYDKLSNSSTTNENSEIIRKRVEKTRKIQQDRFLKNNIKNKKYNSQMSVSDMEKCIKLSTEIVVLLKTSSERLSLSARMYHRIIKIARTIADMEGDEGIEKAHVLEALQFRPKIF